MKIIPSSIIFYSPFDDSDSKIFASQAMYSNISFKVNSFRFFFPLHTLKSSAQRESINGETFTWQRSQTR